MKRVSRKPGKLERVGRQIDAEEMLRAWRDVGAVMRAEREVIVAAIRLCRVVNGEHVRIMPYGNIGTITAQYLLVKSAERLLKARRKAKTAATEARR